jgi:hypothetical protein
MKNCKCQSTLYLHVREFLKKFLRYERAPRGATSWENVLVCVDRFELGSLAVAFLILMSPQIKNASVCVVALRITEKLEQRVCIKFCQNLEKTCTETYDMIKMAFGRGFHETYRSFWVVLLFQKRAKFCGMRGQVRCKTKWLFLCIMSRSRVSHNK